jgi:hypothetical protein
MGEEEVESRQLKVEKKGIGINTEVTEGAELTETETGERSPPRNLAG